MGISRADNYLIPLLGCEGDAQASAASKAAVPPAAVLEPAPGWRRPAPQAKACRGPSGSPCCARFSVKLGRPRPNIPVWAGCHPGAWAQTRLSTPVFDGIRAGGLSLLQIEAGT